MTEFTRNRNPYKDIDWKTQIRVAGSTHLHCTSKEDFASAIDDGLEFATFSNYYPSVPYYPAASIRENTFKLRQPSYVCNGKVVHEPIDFRKAYAEWGEDASLLPADEGNKLFPEPPPGFMEAPNAEHHAFLDYNVYLHITAPGSFFCSGNFERSADKSTLNRHGIFLGTHMPWKEAVREMIDSLMIPDGGGIIINHPAWSYLPPAFICEMLDFDQRVLGIEAINADCSQTFTASSEAQWDSVLATGRQCYGFCAQDHLLDNKKLMGRTILLPEERSAEGCLRAYRQGRFYGNICAGDLDFESIDFDGSTFRVRCNQEAIMILISRQGIVSELWTGREICYTVPEEERGRHVFLRVNATNPKTNGRVFTQAVMLV